MRYWVLATAPPRLRRRLWTGHPRVYGGSGGAGASATGCRRSAARWPTALRQALHQSKVRRRPALRLSWLYTASLTALPAADVYVHNRTTQRRGAPEVVAKTRGGLSMPTRGLAGIGDRRQKRARQTCGPATVRRRAADFVQACRQRAPSRSVAALLAQPPVHRDDSVADHGAESRRPSPPPGHVLASFMPPGSP